MSTVYAADELRPEPAGSVVLISALKPPQSRPSSRKAAIMPRTRDFGVPNSPVRTAVWFSLTVKSL